MHRRLTGLTTHAFPREQRELQKGNGETPYISWKRILARSKALEASDRSIAVSILPFHGKVGRTMEGQCQWLILKLK